MEGLDGADFFSSRRQTEFSSDQQFSTDLRSSDQYGSFAQQLHEFPPTWIPSMIRITFISCVCERKREGEKEKLTTKIW